MSKLLLQILYLQKWMRQHTYDNNVPSSLVDLEYSFLSLSPIVAMAGDADYYPKFELELIQKIFSDSLEKGKNSYRDYVPPKPWESLLVHCINAIASKYPDILTSYPKYLLASPQKMNEDSYLNWLSTLKWSLVGDGKPAPQILEELLDSNIMVKSRVNWMLELTYLQHALLGLLVYEGEWPEKQLSVIEKWLNIILKRRLEFEKNKISFIKFISEVKCCIADSVDATHFQAKYPEAFKVPTESASEGSVLFSNFQQDVAREIKKLCGKVTDIDEIKTSLENFMASLIHQAEVQEKSMIERLVSCFEMYRESVLALGKSNSEKTTEHLDRIIRQVREVDKNTANNDNMNSLNQKENSTDAETHAPSMNNLTSLQLRIMSMLSNSRDFLHVPLSASVSKAPVSYHVCDGNKELSFDNGKPATNCQNHESHDMVRTPVQRRGDEWIFPLTVRPFLTALQLGLGAIPYREAWLKEVVFGNRPMGNVEEYLTDWLLPVLLSPHTTTGSLIRLLDRMRGCCDNISSDDAEFFLLNGQDHSFLEVLRLVSARLSISQVRDFFSLPGWGFLSSIDYVPSSSPLYHRYLALKSFRMDLLVFYCFLINDEPVFNLEAYASPINKRPHVEAITKLLVNEILAVNPPALTSEYNDYPVLSSLFMLQYPELKEACSKFLRNLYFEKNPRGLILYQPTILQLGFVLGARGFSLLEEKLSKGLQEFLEFLTAFPEISSTHLENLKAWLNKHYAEEDRVSAEAIADLLLLSKDAELTWQLVCAERELESEQCSVMLSCLGKKHEMPAVYKTQELSSEPKELPIQFQSMMLLSYVLNAASGESKPYFDLDRGCWLTPPKPMICYPRLETIPKANLPRRYVSFFDSPRQYCEFSLKNIIDPSLLLFVVFYPDSLEPMAIFSVLLGKTVRQDTQVAVVDELLTEKTESGRKQLDENIKNAFFWFMIDLANQRKDIGAIFVRSILSNSSQCYCDIDSVQVSAGLTLDIGSPHFFKLLQVNKNNNEEFSLSLIHDFVQGEFIRIAK